MSDPLILIDPSNEPQITMEPTLEDRVQMLERRADLNTKYNYELIKRIDGAQKTADGAHAAMIEFLQKEHVIMDEYNRNEERELKILGVVIAINIVVLLGWFICGVFINK